jgi:hypothetical protein
LSMRVIREMLQYLRNDVPLISGNTTKFDMIKMYRRTNG